MNPIAWVALCGFVAAAFLVAFLTGYRSAQADCHDRVMQMERMAIAERMAP
jgi:hypothetical protein